MTFLTFCKSLNGSRLARSVWEETSSNSGKNILVRKMHWVPQGKTKMHRPLREQGSSTINIAGGAKGLLPAAPKGYF